MEMISYKCPHCGANLEVGFGARRVVCDYCDSVIMILLGSFRDSRGLRVENW